MKNITSSTMYNKTNPSFAGVYVYEIYALPFQAKIRMMFAYVCILFSQL